MTTHVKNPCYMLRTGPLFGGKRLRPPILISSGLIILSHACVVNFPPRRARYCRHKNNTLQGVTGFHFPYTENKIEH